VGCLGVVVVMVLAAIGLHAIVSGVRF
jgi:hypothetical protein